MIKGIYMTVRIILPLKDQFPKKSKKGLGFLYYLLSLCKSVKELYSLLLYKVQREIFSEAGAKVRLFSITTKFFAKKNKKIKKKTDFGSFFLVISAKILIFVAQNELNREKIDFINSKKETMDMKHFDDRDLQRYDAMTREEQLGMSAAFPALMRKVYVWMAMALAITAITAYGVASSPALTSLIFGNKLIFFGLIIAELVLVFWVSARIEKLSLTKATLMFIVYSVLNGATLATIFFAYSPEIITKTFFVTAGTFGAMAVYGYFTKSDLSSWGKLLIMAVIGLIIAGVVNIFLRSSLMDLVVSVIGVLIFVGLTAYDSQKIKRMLMMQADMGETAQKVALMGALSLYLDFINLFLYLLRLFGRER